MSIAKWVEFSPMELQTVRLTLLIQAERIRDRARKRSRPLPQDLAAQLELLESLARRCEEF